MLACICKIQNTLLDAYRCILWYIHMQDLIVQRVKKQQSKQHPEMKQKATRSRMAMDTHEEVWAVDLFLYGIPWALYHHMTLKRASGPCYHSGTSLVTTWTPKVCNRVAQNH